MRWAADERRLAQASQAVLSFMQRHPIAESWGRADLASADMMSTETTKRVWQARMEPRRNTPPLASIRTYVTAGACFMRNPSYSMSARRVLPSRAWFVMNTL